jgi:hypothetical protein
MLIKQNQLLGEATALLDSIDHLSLNESTFDPSMVNVRHNSRLGQDLIQLESFLGFAQCYGIEDAGLAIHRVCEANSVPRDNLGFVANEENIIADDELADTFTQLAEAGFPCHVARISSDSLYYSSLMEALEMDQEYATLDESANCLNYLNESIITDAKDKASSGYNYAKGKVSGAYGVAKNKVSGAVSVISKKLASVRKALAAKAAEAKKAPASAKALIVRQMDKLKAMAKSLKSKLFDLKDSAANKVSGAAKSAKEAGGKAVDAVSAQASKVKNGITSGIDKLKGKFSKEG